MKMDILHHNNSLSIAKKEKKVKGNFRFRQKISRFFLWDLVYFCMGQEKLTDREKFDKIKKVL